MYGLLLILVLLSACGTMQGPQTRYDDQVDFQSYQNFVWLNAQPLLLAPDTVNPAVVQSLEQVLINALQNKGYVFVTDPFNADLIVSFALESTDASYPIERRHQDEDPDACTPPISADQFGDASEKTTQKQQFMMLNIYDSDRCMNVWHGRIQASFDMFDAVSHQQQKIEKTVHRLLANFPPE